MFLQKVLCSMKAAGITSQQEGDKINRKYSGTGTERDYVRIHHAPQQEER